MSHRRVPRPSRPSRRRRALGLLLLATTVAAWAIALAPLTAYGADAPAEVSTTQLYRQIYKELLTFPCVRLLNNSHAIGCSSPSPSGTTGILYPVNTQQQFDAFSSSAALSDSDGYILVIPFELLSKSIIDQAQASGKVNGMLVVEPATRQPQAIRSHDLPFPDRSASPWVVHDWNPQGSGLLYRDLTGLPIFAVTNATRPLSASLADIVSLADSNRQARPGTPQYAAELSAFMSAAHSASDCLRRGFCKPMGGQSVYAPLFSPPSSSSSSSDTAKPVVLITAALDGKALFQDLAQAAGGRLASVAAVLTAASALGQIPESDRNQWPLRVLVTLFNGESWGHIGSRTFANDLDTFQCRKPFKDGDQPTAACPYVKPACVDPCMLDTEFSQMGVTTKSIAHVLDVNVLWGTKDQLRVHTAGGDAQAPRPFNASIPLSAQPGIPPSPAIAFLERNPSLQAWVLSTLDAGTYPSTFATEYDDRTALLARPGAMDAVCAASDALVRATLVLATGNATAPPTAPVNCTLATALVDCLATATACPLGLSLTSNVPRSSYASVSIFGVGPTWPALVAATLLSNASATVRSGACKTNADCAKGGAAPLCLGGTCVQTPARYHLGWPAGLGVDPASGRWRVIDEGKPHWVESNWDLTAVRVFARVGRGMQWVEVASGVAVTVATGVGVWVVKRRIAGLE